MPYDPHELDALEDGFEPEGEPPDEADDEREDAPAGWDLTSGRAAAGEPRLVSAAELDVAEVITLVWDGVCPDGTLATREQRAGALEAWERIDDRLGRELRVVVTRRTEAGDPVTNRAWLQACRYLEWRRRDWLESGDVLATVAEPYRGGRKPVGKDAVRVTDADGIVTFENLGNDDEAVAEAAASLSGTTLDELRAPFRQGPQSKAEKARRALQAVTIVRLVDAGATQRAIGRVLELDAQRVSERVDLGRRLVNRLG